MGISPKAGAGKEFVRKEIDGKLIINSVSSFVVFRGDFKCNIKVNALMKV